MNTRKIFLALSVLAVGMLACGLPGIEATLPGDIPPEATAGSTLPGATQPPAATYIPGGVIQPDDLVYLGAFRLPDDAPAEVGWMWSGEALTFYPQGDPGGETDGFPGSLFGVGHNWNTNVSEIGIPAPVFSAAKNLDDLNTAVTLQPFADITGGMYPYLEIPRVGLEYLPAQPGQSSARLYFSWAQHMGELETNPTHGWCEITLADPQPAGPWRVGEYINYVTGDYIFAIPQDWADAYLPGMYLATGRFRDGGQGTLGPSIIAIAPWKSGNPPQAGTTLEAVPLLYYGSVYEEGAPAMEAYSHSDEWAGGAWLTLGGRSAVVFAGTKGLGHTWYGCMDGTVWPEEPPFPPDCPERGWWSEQFESQLLFYDPAQLAAVARGEMETWQPQPFAVMRLDDVLFNVTSTQQKWHVGDLAYDALNGYLYLMEPLADNEKSLIHVWQVR